MLSVDELNKRMSELDQEVDKVYVDPTGKALPIYDGVIDPSGYLAAKHRILWILKEPYDEDDGSGGDWSLRGLLLAKDAFSTILRSRTFQPMVYVCYSILNGFPAWRDMSFIRDEPEMAGVLRQIAYINVKKLPGLKRAENGLVSDWYPRAKSLLWKQIDAFAPDIIIGCGPCIGRFIEDAGATSISTHGSAKYAFAGNRLYIDAYHPAQSTIAREIFVDEIRSIVLAMKKMLTCR